MGGLVTKARGRSPEPSRVVRCGDYVASWTTKLPCFCGNANVMGGGNRWAAWPWGRFRLR
jgi:hypothetical protein